MSAATPCQFCRKDPPRRISRPSSNLRSILRSDMSALSSRNSVRTHLTHASISAVSFTRCCSNGVCVRQVTMAAVARRSLVSSRRLYNVSSANRCCRRSVLSRTTRRTTKETKALRARREIALPTKVMRANDNADVVDVSFFVA